MVKKKGRNKRKAKKLEQRKIRTRPLINKQLSDFKRRLYEKLIRKPAIRKDIESSKKVAGQLQLYGRESYRKVSQEVKLARLGISKPAKGLSKNVEQTKKAVRAIIRRVERIKSVAPTIRERVKGNLNYIVISPRKAVARIATSLNTEIEKYYAVVRDAQNKLLGAIPLTRAIEISPRKYKIEVLPAAEVPLEAPTIRVRRGKVEEIAPPRRLPPERRPPPVAPLPEPEGYEFESAALNFNRCYQFAPNTDIDNTFLEEVAELASRVMFEYKRVVRDEGIVDEINLTDNELIGRMNFNNNNYRNFLINYGYIEKVEIPLFGYGYVGLYTYVTNPGQQTAEWHRLAPYSTPSFGVEVNSAIRILTEVKEPVYITKAGTKSLTNDQIANNLLAQASNVLCGLEPLTFKNTQNVINFFTSDPDEWQEFASMLSSVEDINAIQTDRLVKAIEVRGVFAYVP